MNVRPLYLTAVLASMFSVEGCALRNYVIDEAQVDSLTFCAASGTQIPFVSSSKSWGRVRDENGNVEWSHYALGTFACKTQDEWLCEARTGKTQCKGLSLRDQLETGDSDTHSDADHRTEVHETLRNETQSEMLLQSDRLCDRYLASIFGEQAGNALALDTAGSLLSGAAAIATGITARNLSAGSAFLGATRSHINADVYQSQVSTAINLLIRKNRGTAREVIRNNQECAPKRYSASDAVQDALTYHNMCSFEYGLSELVREASDNSPVRGSVAALVLQQLQKQLADAQKEPADSKNANEKANYDASIAALKSKIRVYEGFGVTVPSAAPSATATTAKKSDTPKLDGQSATQQGATKPGEAASGCALLPLAPVSR